MKSAVQLVVLLACIFLCSSARSIMRCKCIKTISAVRTRLIADAKVYKPGPSCSLQEVIVILKDKTQLCLDPAGRQKAVFVTCGLKQEKRKTGQAE
uniref:C-X-C motif chemokine n=1 Tax=Xiphophorus maculatus TaxID=8083 RepID=A0A3B5Q7D8_XIPMA